MAGEWIKVDRTTPEKPEVLRIARELCVDRDAVFGKVMLVWMWFDANSRNGVVDGAVDADVDALVRQVGFAHAMRAVGWLSDGPKNHGLKIPNFDRHNGETAKKRALTNRRQSRWRNASVDAPRVTNASTREEKRRITTPIPPSGEFSRFWSAWPKHHRKQAQGKCWEKWRKGNCDAAVEQILSHVEALKRGAWLKDGGEYIPAPLAYLNKRAWEGADLADAASAGNVAPLYRREGVM